MEPQQAKLIWSEIIAEAKSQSHERQMGEITVREFQEETGLGRCAARYFLEDKCRQGKLRKRKLYLAECGAVTSLYSPVETP